MGVPARIVLYAPDEQAAHDAAAAGFARIAELDAMMSDYRPTSELSRLGELSEGEGGREVPVSGELLEVLELAKAISRESGGVFDVTVGPMTQLWRRSRREQRLPDAQELEAARAVVGWRLVEIDRRAGTVRLARPGMRLDLGGIAKGYAAQKAVERMGDLGVDRALAAMAGDIYAGRAPPRTPGWRIDTPGGRLTIENAAVSTSGDTEQFVEIGGERYSHIVDPRTGVGLRGHAIVTVVAPQGALADGWASALRAMID